MKSHQITRDILHRSRTNNPKIYMEPQKKNRIAKAILGGWGTSRKHNSARLQTKLQSYSNQDSIVLVPKQTDRPMEQNRECRNKP